MERTLARLAPRGLDLPALVGCQHCGRAFALWAAGLTGLTGTLALVAGDIANTQVVQTVAQLLARGLPF